MKFSKSTGCFYPTQISYTNVPPDALDVPDDDFTIAMLRPTGTTLDIASGRILIIPQAAPTKEDLRAAIDAQIVGIERETICNRLSRETLLIQLVQVAASQTPSVSSAALYAANKGFKALKDVDGQIKALRAQRDAI